MKPLRLAGVYVLYFRSTHTCPMAMQKFHFFMRYKAGRIACKYEIKSGQEIFERY
jgi:hypothetical protein